MSATAPDTPAAYFARIIATLCAMVAASGERPAMNKPGLKGPLIVAIWNRLNRMAQRITRLAARVAAGTLRPPRRRPGRARGPARGPTPAAAKLPRARAWLVRLLQPTTVGANYLRILLDDPEMQTLIAAAPQIGRILRPFWHMVSTDPLPPVLQRLRPVPPAPSPPAEAARCPAAPPARAKPSRPTRTKPPAPEVARSPCLRPATA